MNKEILEFITSQRGKKFPSSRLFTPRNWQVYMRAGCYHYEHSVGVRKWAVGVARVDVNPAFVGTGIFREFITDLEKVAADLGYAVVRFEQVHNTELFAKLQKHGYVQFGLNSDLSYDNMMVKHLA